MPADNRDQDRTHATGTGQEAPRRRPFRLSLALPLAQLLFCAALILIVCGPRSLMPVGTGTIYVQVMSIATHHPVGPYPGGKTALQNDNSQRGDRAEEPSDRRVWIRGRVLSSLMLLNIPGALVQIEAARYGSNHHGWLAWGTNAFISSQLSISLLALPFWWVAGRGADALLGMRRNVIAPRLGLLEAAIAFVLFVGAGFLAVGGLLAFVVGRDKPASPLITVSLLLWCFLGAMTVRARYKQRHKLGWKLAKKALSFSNQPEPTSKAYR